MDVLSVSFKASKAEFQKREIKLLVSPGLSQKVDTIPLLLYVLVKQWQSQSQFKKRKHRPNLSVNGIPGRLPKNV